MPDKEDRKVCSRLLWASWSTCPRHCTYFFSGSVSHSSELLCTFSRLNPGHMRGSFRRSVSSSCSVCGVARMCRRCHSRSHYPSAYSTNPGDASFRSFLTELSLHQHIRKLRQNSPTAPTAWTEDELEGVTRSEVENASSPHMLTFANRISVSLRTPRYDRRDFGLFSTVIVPATSLDSKFCSHHEPSALTTRRYVGVFGKWWIGGITRMPSADRQKQSKASKTQPPSTWGVMAMSSLDGHEVDESECIGGLDARTDLSDTLLASARAAMEKALITKTATLKQHLSSQATDASQPPSGRPSGRRKKQGQRPRPSPLLPGGELSATGRGTSSEMLSASNSGLPASTLDTASHTLQAIAPDQPSPTTQSAPTSLLDTGGNAIAILEVQTQLDQVRLASETAKKQLQSQLEELRSRKRDEDAARLDVKGRMKTLDESKRHAEGTKREAERRLKVANGLRDAIESRIEAKAQEVRNLRAREEAHRIKVSESAKRKTARTEEIRLEIQRKGEEGGVAEEALYQLQSKLETLHERLLEEEANLEAARELAAERDAAHHNYPSSSSTHYQAVYPLLSGLGEVLPPSEPDGVSSSTMRAGWGGIAPGHVNFAAGPVPMTSDEIKGEADFDETFDPTISASSHDEPAQAGFAPFSFDQSAFHSRLLDQQALQSRTGSLTDGAGVPVSPFTSDLLPSNLFQNADDDETHVGVLPGSRSERVEAALNRFGLDTSDTSDVEASYEKHPGQDDETRSEEAEGPTDLESGNVKASSRNWWGGRSRNGSKDRSISNGSSVAVAPASGAAASSDATVDSASDGQSTTKRRSLSIFPKLSLNPGAKSFRGGRKDASGAAFDEYNESLGMHMAWNHSTGQVPTRQDFESMKRAFQTNNLSTTNEEEDQGRRSWSAFDTWQQQQHGNRPPRFPSHLDAMYLQNQRSSSDSIAHHQRNLVSQRGDWLDDVFSPLHKSQSIDDQSSASSSSLSRNQRGGKPSRFAFWSSGSNSNQASSSSPLAAVDAGTLEAGSNPTGAPVIGSSSSGTPQPTKRSSFRWSRRQDSSSDALFPFSADKAKTAQE